MKNITPTTPSFIFGYWRPWKENANFFDSYLDYVRDANLVKYGADTVGNYISQASKEQVDAINQAGKAIGIGMNALSSQLSGINSQLTFLNRNLDIVIEQQKLSNLLLQNIAELLRVPDSEKERQLSIELGIKFFVNAEKDPDLYTDSLEAFLKAESLMKQDYFVLHRIGYIYLFVEKYLNPEKALDYFLRAAKYASVESDPNAMRLFNALLNKPTQNENLIKAIEEYKDNFDNDFSELWDSEYDWYIELDSLKLYFVNYKEVDDIKECDENEKIYYEEILKYKNIDSELKKEIKQIQSDINNIINKFGLNFDQANAYAIAAISYEKAAFASYILGQYGHSVEYQKKAVQFNSTPQNKFILSKYLVRNGNINNALSELNQAIDDEPALALAVFKEIDLFNEPEVLKLINEKNTQIDSKIKQLIDEYISLNITPSKDVLDNLNELTLKAFEIKVKYFKDIEKTIIDIDNLLAEITNSKFSVLNPQIMIDKLDFAKGQPLEIMQQLYKIYLKETEADKLKIGSKHAGGIIFYLDKSGEHGLVCPDKYFENSIWGKHVFTGTM